MMETFLDKHRSQHFEPHLYDEVFLRIFQGRLLSKPWSFKFHTCFDNSVSFMHSRCLKNFVWLLYRALNSPSLNVVDISLYARHWVRHSPFNGQFHFDLKLHLRLFLSFVLLSTLEWCCLWWCFRRWWRSNNFASKCLGWKSCGICCSWRIVSSQAWWTVCQYLFSHFGYMVGWTISPFCFYFFKRFKYRCYWKTLMKNVHYS